MSAARKAVFSFATMMIRAQQRHQARLAASAEQAELSQREQALRRTLQKMNGTKRLVVFMYPA